MSEYWEKWTSAANPPGPSSAELTAEERGLIIQEHFTDFHAKYNLKHVKIDAMPPEIVSVWIQSLRSAGKLPSDVLAWKSLCGHTVVKLLYKAATKFQSWIQTKDSVQAKDLPTKWLTKGTAQNGSL